MLSGRLARTAVAAVRLVEAAALEDDADVPEDLAHRGSTGGAVGQRVVVKRLDEVEVLLAAVAVVFVGGQASISSRSKGCLGLAVY